MKNLRAKIEQAVIRESLSSRGGGIEIDLGQIYKAFAGKKMTAYQNYLGGGILGCINNDCTIENWRANKKLKGIAEDLSRYMHELTNHSDCEWESSTFEENQTRPSSAY